MDSKNIKYLIFTVILLILSGIGTFLMFQINNSPFSLFFASSTVSTVVIPTPTSIPTTIPTISKITPTATISATPAATITATPTATTSSAKKSPTPTAKITATLTPIPTPTSSPTGLTDYKNTTDGFSVQYSSKRKFFQDTESTGNRYTFYSSSGNFAIHVASSGTWSWTNPDRKFSSDLIVSGKNTYRYDISTQTIVDLQSNTKNYTLQCVHNSNATLKAECEAFIASFTLL